MQLFLVAELQDSADIQVAKKDKLIGRLKSKPKDFTWSEAVTLMRACGFRLFKNSGSARWWVHETTKQKVRLHEPHPQNTLLDYMVKELLEALREAGEI